MFLSNSLFKNVCKKKITEQVALDVCTYICMYVHAKFGTYDVCAYVHVEKSNHVMYVYICMFVCGKIEPHITSTKASRKNMVAVTVTVAVTVAVTVTVTVITAEMLLTFSWHGS